jgi:hypothetical protein
MANGRTQEIADFLKVEYAVAMDVHNYIDDEGLLDWSECTQAEWQRTVREAHKDLKEN